MGDHAVSVRATLSGAAVAVGAPGAVMVAHAAGYGRWVVDDAAITWAYARSLTEGWGPVAQPGAAPVEGWSNPTWLALHAVGRLAGLFDTGAWFGVPDYVWFPKALGVLCCLAVFAGFYAAACAVTRRPGLLAAAAGMALAVVPSWVIWAVSGLETSLLAAAVAWLVVLLVRAAATDRLTSPWIAAGCGALAAVAALTRPDAAIYAAAHPLVVLLAARGGLWPRLRAGLVSVAVFAVPAGAYLWWRWARFGLLVPNTAVAKAQEVPGVEVAWRAGELVDYVGPAVAVTAAVAVLAALAVGARRELVALLVPLTLAVAAFVVLRPDWMAQLRFATPVWTLGALTAAVAVAVALRPVPWPGRVAAAGALATVAYLAAPAVLAHARGFRAAPTVPMCSIAAHMGWSFNGYARMLGLPPGAALVTPDVGGTALTSQLRIIDLAGLIDPGLARRWHDGDMAGLRDDVFGRRPEFIETHHGWSWTTGLVTDPRLDERYATIRRTAPGDGVWVRRDLLGPGDLDRLRAWDAQVAAPVEHHHLAAAPLGSCGPTLGPWPDPLDPPTSRLAAG